jgi:hypothetical protein
MIYICSQTRELLSPRLYCLTSFHSTIPHPQTTPRHTSSSSVWRCHGVKIVKGTVMGLAVERAAIEVNELIFGNEVGAQNSEMG